MNYYDDIKNVQEYISMAEGYDGRQLIDLLQQYLPVGSTLLELGMGPGKDLDLLSHSYRVTGSDNSQIFLDLFRQKNEKADLLLLDAKVLETERTFDCIFSNKVLHHLSEDELRESFIRQQELLNPRGVLFHSFWWGDKEQYMHGLRFRYYTEADLLSIVEQKFVLLEVSRYTEMEQDDSIYLVLKLADN